MARFLQDKDYTALIRDEIKGILLENYTEEKQYTAEQMAISQIKNYITGYYDTDKVFETYDALSDPDPRNHFIVMITIDCTLYHLYTSTAPDRIPEHRAQRYGDALDWLKGVAKGNIKADLPLITGEDGTAKPPVRIKSRYAHSNNKW
jgi:phage gp36-like protein